MLNAAPSAGRQRKLRANLVGVPGKTTLSDVTQNYKQPIGTLNIAFLTRMRENAQLNAEKQFGVDSWQARLCGCVMVLFDEANSDGRVFVDSDLQLKGLVPSQHGESVAANHLLAFQLVGLFTGHQM